MGRAYVARVQGNFPRPSTCLSLMAAPSRPYDLIIWGASGFTGKLVAEHLAKLPSKPLRWALAGRSQAKLEAVRASLGPQAASVPVLTADPSDSNALDAVIGSGRVVLAMAGPYALYGLPVVESAVRNKVDYLDITGEAPFMRRVIDTHNASAKAQGSVVCHTVGYDSVPWDLGAYLAVKQLRESGDLPTDARIKVEGFVGDTIGGFSGGTVASMLNMMKNPGDMAVLMNSQSLNPDGAPSSKARPQGGPAYSASGKRWTMPSLMAAVNEKVVHRSAALRPDFYGRDFSYSESTLAPNAVGAYIGAGLMGLVGLSLAFPPSRWLLAHTVLPKPGQGPSESVRENGHFAALFLGSVEGSQKRSLVRIAKRNADPGYKATSMMAAEAALCLALERAKCPCASSSDACGVTTPAVALGDVLVDRLKAQGFVIEVRPFAENETVPDA